jgi:predicted small lipoprotein YifL
MRPLARVVALAALLTSAAGCGQQGPLVLPEEARPVERVDAPPADSSEPDDEQQDER